MPQCIAPYLDVAPGNVSLASPWQPSLQPVVINAVKQVKEVPFLEGELPAGHTNMYRKQKHQQNMERLHIVMGYSAAIKIIIITLENKLYFVIIGYQNIMSYLSV